MTKITLTNQKAGYFSNNQTIVGRQSKTDTRYVLDLENIGFAPKEITYKMASDGYLTVTGKVLSGVPEYDADGNLDKFGINADRAPFEVKLWINPAKYDISTVKVATDRGSTRIQALKHGHRMSAPKRNLSGTWKNPTVKARKRTTSGYNYQVYRCTPVEDFFFNECPCACYGSSRSYYVPAPYTVRSGSALAHANN